MQQDASALSPALIRATRAPLLSGTSHAIVGRPTPAPVAAPLIAYSGSLAQAATNTLEQDAEDWPAQHTQGADQGEPLLLCKSCCSSLQVQRCNQATMRHLQRTPMCTPYCLLSHRQALLTVMQLILANCGAYVLHSCHDLMPNSIQCWHGPLPFSLLHQPWV